MTRQEVLNEFHRNHGCTALAQDRLAAFGIGAELMYSYLEQNGMLKENANGDEG